MLGAQSAVVVQISGVTTMKYVQISSTAVNQPPATSKTAQKKTD